MEKRISLPGQWLPVLPNDSAMEKTKLLEDRDRPIAADAISLLDSPRLFWGWLHGPLIVRARLTLPVPGGSSILTARGGGLLEIQDRAGHVPFYSVGRCRKFDSWKSWLNIS